MRKRTAKPAKYWVLVGLLLAAAVIALLGPGFSARLRGSASCVLAPFGDGGMYLATAFHSRGDSVGGRSVSPAEARRMAEEIRQLREQVDLLIQANANLLASKEMLGRLYGQMPYEQWEFIPARVVAGDSLPYGRTRLLNAGRDGGVTTGAAVTTHRLLTDRSKALPRGLAAISSASTLVGRIIHTGAFTARLQLITDSNFSANAAIRRVVDPDKPRRITITEGVAREVVLTEQTNPLIDVLATGDGAGWVIVNDVYADENVRPGDWLLTSGRDSLLPAQIYIGKVEQVIDDPKRRGLFVSLKVRPYANLQALREVYIVQPIALPEPGKGDEGGN